MAKSSLAGIILVTLFATTGWAATPSPSLIVSPPQPKWSELTVQQKTVLAPLSDDWDSLEYHRQKKWLGIASRFSSMTPKEQRRIQVQMQEWGKLTDEEREQARENYISAKQLPIEKKRELKKKWEEYSSLPAEERARLRERAIQFVNKSVTVKPSETTASQPSSNAGAVVQEETQPKTMDTPAPSEDSPSTAEPPAVPDAPL